MDIFEEMMGNLNKPKVVTWFKGYCWLLATCSLTVILLFLWAFIDCSEADEIGVTEGRILASIFIFLGLVMLAISLLGVYLRPRPWVWTYSLVLICLGMTTGWLMPLCIPLIIFWVKKETKTYHQVNS